jgi:hypothetical protein
MAHGPNLWHDTEERIDRLERKFAELVDFMDGISEEKEKALGQASL